MRSVLLRLCLVLNAIFAWGLTDVLIAVPRARADFGPSTGVAPPLPAMMRMPLRSLLPLLSLPHMPSAQYGTALGVGMPMPRPLPQFPLNPSLPARPMPRVSLQPAGSASPGQACRRAIANAERIAGIPQHLLAAIAHVESGRRDPQTGVVDPWPWSINVEGTDHVYDTEPEVIAAVRMFQSQGRRSIDVGCLQVNLMYHPDAFASLEEAFDPGVNAAYAAKFLTDLYRQTGTWSHATANYHSASPDLGSDYERKVMAVFPDEQHAPAAQPGFAALSMPISPAPTMTMAQIIPMPGIAARMVTGRTLESYRMTPVSVSRRP